MCATFSTLKDFSQLSDLSIEYPECNEDYSNKLSAWAGSFKKTLPERQGDLMIVLPDLDIEKLNSGGLSPETANIMIENCIGVLGLPIGIAPNFIINRQHFIVPMAVEEPSIIAACSSISKLVAQNGGFTSNSTDNIMTAQIQILDLSQDQLSKGVNYIKQNEKEFIDRGNEFCTSMVLRGGGVTKIEPRVVKSRDANRYPYLVVHIHVNVCEAMGANIVNTIAEGLAEDFVTKIGGRAGLKILTNLNIERRTIATFRIPVRSLGWKGVDGKEVANRVLEAYHFALDDEFRAATNNKGVMNGIDAVCVALGQDFRAIESSAHAFACRNGFYGPIANYKILNDESVGYCLIGTLELPIAVGSKGGALGTHPIYRVTHALVGNPNAKTISQILACVGLAQNFGALRALAIEGIQRGHMSLHAKNIASTAGVPTSLIEEVATYMIDRKLINSESAKHYIDARQIYANSPVIGTPKVSNYCAPSTLYVEIPGHPEPISLNIVMSTTTIFPIHLEMKPETSTQVNNNNRSELKKKAKNEKMIANVFGKTYEWFVNLYQNLDLVKLNAKVPSRSNSKAISQLKLISILINVASDNLVRTCCDETREFLNEVLKSGYEIYPMSEDGTIEGITERKNQETNQSNEFNSRKEQNKDRVRAIFEIKSPKSKDYNLFEDFVTIDEENVLKKSPSWVMYGHSMISALLQSFFHRLKCLVEPTHPLLALHIAHQQLKILETIRNRSSEYTPALTTTWESFEVLVQDFQKRWQMTMVLLCDLLMIPPTLLTHEKLNFVEKLGSVFEYQAMILHDISRRNEDLPSSSNAYLEWIRLSKKQNTKASLKEFLKHYEDRIQTKTQEILDLEKNLNLSDFFDTKIFLQSCYYLQQYYQQSTIIEENKLELIKKDAFAKTKVQIVAKLEKISESPITPLDNTPSISLTSSTPSVPFTSFTPSTSFASTPSIALLSPFSSNVDFNFNSFSECLCQILEKRKVDSLQSQGEHEDK